MKALLISLAFLSTACSMDFTEVFVLDRLRVVALIADSPEIDTAGTATITPYVSDLLGEGRTINYEAKTCLDPGVGFGAEPTCDGSATETDLGTGTIGGLTAPNYTGLSSTTFAITPGTTAPDATTVFLGQSDANQYNGVVILFTIELTTANGAIARAFKRIYVSSKTTKNANPSFTADGILSGGSALTALPTEKVDLLAELTSGAETYTFRNDDLTDETKSEELFVSWFISNGQLSTGFTDLETATSFTPPIEAPTDHDTLIIAVIRDDRGGVDVVQKEF